MKVFKKKRRKGFESTRGHRQPYTCLEIQKIKA
ncbi:MAG: bL21 family ribosomal protein [Myxococcota bacterium]